MYHITYEDGAWPLWRDGRVIRQFTSREEALEAIR